jgi:sphingolipid delta-4 desaturase
MSWPVFVCIAWIYGGAASHALSLMTHEISHNLIFKSTDLNTYFGILCNVGMGFPSSTTFKRYHMEHHQFQGDLEKDVDIPTLFEGKYFSNTFMKFLFVFLIPVTYGARPGIVRPKDMRAIDLTNIACIVISDLCVFYFCGISGLGYLVMSLWLGMSFHPVAGHFIAEHFVFAPGHETYSYYGSLNLICWNVGYHNEHHDFPRVPGWKLPLVTKIAPEFYDNLPQHKSWSYVLYRFITDPTIGPNSRVIR